MNAEDNTDPEEESFHHEFSPNGAELKRVRRVGFLGPETVGAQATIDQLAEAFSSEGVEAESVSAVSVGDRTFLIIDVGEGSVEKIVKFLAGLLATELKEAVLGLIGNRAFTHRLNVALDAAGHGTDLLLPDEIVWVVPESLEGTMRELDEAFPSALKAHREDRERSEDPPEGAEASEDGT